MATEPRSLTGKVVAITGGGRGLPSDLADYLDIVSAASSSAAA